MDKGKTQSNEPKDKEIDDKAQSLTPERWYSQFLCQEKKEEEEEDSSTLSLA